MNFEWFKTEHHRMHVIEEWPESPHKQAALAAIRSKLASLARQLPPGTHVLGCEVCLSGEGRSRFLTFPVAPNAVQRPLTDLAA